jgi:hypothetical protein
MKKLLLGIFYLLIPVSFLLGFIIFVGVHLESLIFATIATTISLVLVLLTIEGVSLIMESYRDRKFMNQAKKTMKKYEKTLSNLED